MSLERVTVQDAAKILGVTEHAVRQRLYRGTLEAEKDGDGRVFVLLPEDLGESPGESPERDSPRDLREMVAILSDEVRYLREQLDLTTARSEERDRENRRLLAAALERIPAIEPPPDTPPEPRESPVSPGEEAGKGETPGPSEEPVAPWWRRWFGG